MLNLILAEGELHCLIGPNGAGKSTVFKLIMGLLAPQSGQVLFRDRAVTRLPPFRRVRLGLGMTYQSDQDLLPISRWPRTSRWRGTAALATTATWNGRWRTWA